MKAGIVAAAVALAFPLFAAEQLPDVGADRLAPGRLVVEPSFQAASVYFRAPRESRSPYALEYRRAGAEAWSPGFEPVCDQPPGFWKASVFDLAEDTAWEVRVLDAERREVIAPVGFRTWSTEVPIARVIDLSALPGAQHGLVISDQGTPDGWIKYTAPAGWRLERPHDPDDPQLGAITFRNARYVILENITVVGGARYAVHIEDCESVRILNCDLSGWGRMGVQQFSNTGRRGMYFDAKGEAINLDGAVTIDRSARTVVERCYIHDPRGRANSWMFAHPAGPSAIHANYTRGGTVLRWNDCIGSDEHRWNDVIEGRSNADPAGGFFRDSDISGNFLAFGNDDGIELEGGGMNVRFDRNKIEGTTCGVSTGPCFIGPQFIHRNLIVNPGDETGLALMFFKNSHRLEQSGKRHFVHNTLHGARGSAYGAYGRSGGGDERLGYMRNNVFVINSARMPGEESRRDDFDHNVYWADGDTKSSAAFLAGLRRIGQETHGVAVDPRLAAPQQGDFRPGHGSPVRGQSAAVPNMAVAGANPGAFTDDTTEVPYRPLSMVAAPRQLEFSEPQSVSRQTVTLTVPTGAEAVPFQIRQNSVFTWFKVTPSSGTVHPGRPVTLTVTVAPEALEGRPKFRGAFLVRTPTGLSRPVTVYAASRFLEDLRPREAAGAVYLEAAELARDASRLRETREAGVSAGRFIALEGDGKDPDIEARFTLPKSGTYHLLLRGAISGEVMQGREFDLAIDDGAPAPVGIHPSYQWNTGATHFRAVYLYAMGELAAGEHRLRLKLRRGELKLNELIITDDPTPFFADAWQSPQRAPKRTSQHRNPTIFLK